MLSKASLLAVFYKLGGPHFKVATTLPGGCVCKWEVMELQRGCSRDASGFPRLLQVLSLYWQDFRSS